MSVPTAPTQPNGGHCLCKGVEFYFDGPHIVGCAGSICYCHCMMCNHALGSTSPGAIAMPLRHLKFKSRSTLKEYQSSPNVTRSFCNECGCTLLMHYTDFEPSTIWIYASTLDDRLQNSKEFVALMKDPKKTTHIWLGDKANWYEPLEDGIPRSFDATGLIADSCKPTEDG